MCNKYEKREIRKRAKAFHTTVVFCQFWLFYNSRMRIILYTLPSSQHVNYKPTGTWFHRSTCRFTNQDQPDRGGLL